MPGRHVPHGWRATFSTVMNERYKHDRHIIDLMLAHVPKNSEESRATLSPCDASGIAHPQKMSSTVAGSTAACSSAARITRADTSVACTLASAPSFLPFPTADRTAEMITASLILSLLSDCHVRNP